VPNYEKSYWKAVELMEKVYEGKIKLHKVDIEAVIGLLREIQNVAFEEDSK